MWTAGAMDFADSRWIGWSSKKMWGRSSDRKRAFSMPPRNSVSSSSTSHSLRVKMHRSMAAALRAVINASLKVGPSDGGNERRRF